MAKKTKAEKKAEQSNEEFHKIIKIDGTNYANSTVTYFQHKAAEIIINDKGRVIKNTRGGKVGIPAEQELLDQAVEIHNSALALSNDDDDF